MNFDCLYIGCLAKRVSILQRTFKHNRMNFIEHDRCGILEEIDFLGSSIFKPFYETKTMQESLAKGEAALLGLGMRKLNASIKIYLRTSLMRTSKDHFVIFASFLHSIMALAGYGRALSYSSAPEQKPERKDDIHGVAQAIEDLMMDLNLQAVNDGFSPPVGEKWIPACIGYWKSTSAGVAPVTIDIEIDGKKVPTKFRKKAAIGALMGRNAFKRETLRVKMTEKNPGSVGNRDVPYKPTRSIYVVSLPTQCAQIAVISHLVNFVSTKGKNVSQVSKPIDPSHCTTGPYSSSGQRLVDNYDTIAASGDPAILAIGTDLSSYDASLVYWNFRKPMLSALKRMGMGNTFVMNILLTKKWSTSRLERDTYINQFGIMEDVLLSYYPLMRILILVVTFANI